MTGHDERDPRLDIQDEAAAGGGPELMPAEIWSAMGATLSAVAPGPPNMPPMNGIMSTTISLPTLSG